MQLAIFKRLGEYGGESVCEKWAENHESYVRLTEFVDVQFPALQEESVVGKQLEALDRAEQTLRDKFQAALGGIEHQRAELRAITYKPADPAPYCSYGHKTKASCDCGPIADNE